MRTNMFIQIFVEREYRIQASKRRTSSDLLSCPSFEDRHSDEWSAEATHRTGELHGSTDAWYLKFRTCRATHTLALWSKSEFQWLPIRDHSFDQDGMMIVYSVQLAPGFLEMRACATKVLATPSVTLSKSFRCYGVLCLMKHISWSVHSPYATESESDKYQTHMTCFAWLSEALALSSVPEKCEQTTLVTKLRRMRRAVNTALSLKRSGQGTPKWDMGRNPAGLCNARNGFLWVSPSSCLCASALNLREPEHSISDYHECNTLAPICKFSSNFANANGLQRFAKTPKIWHMISI